MQTTLVKSGSYSGITVPRLLVSNLVIRLLRLSLRALKTKNQCRKSKNSPEHKEENKASVLLTNQGMKLSYSQLRRNLQKNSRKRNLPSCPKKKSFTKRYLMDMLHQEDVHMA